MTIKEHISYSELKVWNNCPYAHKLMYIDKIKNSDGSIHTIAGTAIHKVCEMLVKNEIKEELSEYTKKTFKEFYDASSIKVEEKEYLEFEKQLCMLSSIYLDSLKNHFGEFTFVSAEEPLMENISLLPKYQINKFKGYIDLIIKTADGKIHVIDNKLCSWGWEAKKKSDAMLSYQLTFYKYFYAQKHNLNPENIETHFCLLKRTAKKDNVEIFRVTSGPKKTTNAFNILNNGIHNIQKGFYPKNKLNCTYCEFKKTKECP